MYSCNDYLLKCSSFKIFSQLYKNYAIKAEETLQPLLLSDHINTEVALPISVITENLPVLRVRCIHVLVIVHAE